MHKKGKNCKEYMDNVQFSYMFHLNLKYIKNTDKVVPNMHVKHGTEMLLPQHAENKTKPVKNNLTP